MFSPADLTLKRTINMVDAVDVSVAAIPNLSAANVQTALEALASTSLRDLGSLPSSGSDLNTIKTPGLYKQPLNAGATAGSNYPVAQAGVLEVLAWSSASVIQRYTPWTQSGADAVRPWVRSYYSISDSWSAWQALALKADASRFATAAQGAKADTALQIETGIFRLASITGGAALPANVIEVFVENRGAKFSLIDDSAYGALPASLRFQAGVRKFGISEPLLRLEMAGGIVNDTASCTAALHDCALTGRPIRLGIGTYPITPQAIAINFDISGDDMEQSILRWVASTGSISLLQINGGVAKWRIRNLTIDSDRQSHTDPASGYFAAVDMINLSNGASLELDGVIFRNGRIIDVRMTGPLASDESCDCVISRCRFVNGLQSTNAATRSPQCVSLTEGIHLVASDNYFESQSPDGVTTFGRAGIAMQRPGGSTSLSWGSFIATNNRFKNIGKTPNAVGCLYVYSGARQVIMLGNIADNPYGSVFVAKADAEQIIIAHNTVRGQRYAQGFCCGIYDQADTYTTSAGKTLLVQGNSVVGAEGNAYYVDGARAGGLSKFDIVLFDSNIAIDVLRVFSLRNLRRFRATNIYGRDFAAFCYVSNELEGRVEFDGITMAGGTTAFNFAISSAFNSDLRLKNISVSGITNQFLVTEAPFRSIVVDDLEIDGSSALLSTAGTVDVFALRRARASGIAANQVWPTRTGSYGSIEWQDVRGIEAPSALRTVRISSGAIAVTMSSHQVLGEGGMADTLTTINGGEDGGFVTLFGVNNTQAVTVANGGNIFLAGGVSFVIDSSRDTLTLLRRGGQWLEIARSNNGS